VCIAQREKSLSGKQEVDRGRTEKVIKPRWERRLYKTNEWLFNDKTDKNSNHSELPAA
jgi:hypothetical protein